MLLCFNNNAKFESSGYAELDRTTMTSSGFKDHIGVFFIGFQQIGAGSG